MSEEEVGRVQSFFRKPSVAAMVLTGDLSIGDNIRIRGATTDIEMTVESMQINLESVESAGAGDDVGIKVPEREAAWFSDLVELMLELSHSDPRRHGVAEAPPCSNIPSMS